MSVHHKWSLITLCLAALSLLYITTIYYPRYERTGVNGTLSYDVGGYYLYLPATFIYKDLKYFSFQDTLKSDPINVTTFQGKFHDNGGFTIKYPAGMAIQYLPFFTVAHIWACNSKVHASNGYSFPYQTMIYFGSVLIAFIGLFYLRKVLLLHFSDSITSLTLASIFFGSNYMAYASINAAMSHNYLFTINAILLYKISNYYKTPILQQAVYMGFLIGLAALTRPTEIITALIAVFWGINILSDKELKKRVQWIRRYKNHYIAAITMAFAVGSIQFIYWYYVTGNPIVFSYSNDDGFDFLSPHIWKCLFSVKAGWLLYSPIMFFTLAGFYILYQKDKSLFCSIFLYFILFTYVTFSWNNWWYGGSLGQRAMVQSYPFLAFPMAYFYGYIRYKSKAIICITTLLFLLFIYMNIWATHMSHNGKLFLTPPHLSTAYFKKVVGTWKQNNNDLKLLDTDEV